MTSVSTGRRPSRGSWRRTAAWYRVPGVTALAVALGVAFGRPDLVLLAAPLLLGWVAALLAGRHLVGRAAPRAVSVVDADSFGNNAADVVTTVIGGDGVEFASVAQPGEGRGPIGRMVTLAGGAATRTIRSRFRTTGWGTTTVARPDSLGAGPDGLYLAGPVRRAPTRTELILPAVASIPPFTLPPIIGGWAGAHVSRRPGQGSDLIDLREYAPGDRLRSIHWRAYARHERLYTTRTLSDADAELMICLDQSAHFAPRRVEGARGMWRRAARRVRVAIVVALQTIDARRDPAGHAARVDAERRLRATSLDHAVAAAAAVAAAHLGQGDRVGVMTATVPRRLLRPSTGNRQLQRIRHQLALLDDRRTRMLQVAWWGLTPGQIVVWCSPLVTPAAVHAAIECAARGHRVIVVDTLPLAGMLARATAAEADHLRVLAVERQLELDRLRGRGIPVISWDAGDLPGQIAEATRVMRGRR